MIALNFPQCHHISHDFQRKDYIAPLHILFISLDLRRVFSSKILEWYPNPFTPHTPLHFKRMSSSRMREQKPHPVISHTFLQICRECILNRMKKVEHHTFRSTLLSSCMECHIVKWGSKLFLVLINLIRSVVCLLLRWGECKKNICDYLFCILL